MTLVEMVVGGNPDTFLGLWNNEAQVVTFLSEFPNYRIKKVHYDADFKDFRLTSDTTGEQYVFTTGDLICSKLATKCG